MWGWCDECRVWWVANRCRTVEVPDALGNAVCPCIASLQVGSLDEVEASVGSRQANGPLEDTERGGRGRVVGGAEWWEGID